MSVTSTDSVISMTPWNMDSKNQVQNQKHIGGAPTGTVTLVFTDIEGSSSLWENYGEDFAPVLNLHQEIFRRAIALFNGYEVKTEGDAFMVAFAKPLEAVRFCMTVQSQLERAPWPHRLLGDQSYESRNQCSAPIRGLRVRMGAHTGPVSTHRDPTTGRMDYFGPSVNRAARVSDAAHGGQLLLSRATWGLVKDELQATKTKSFGEFQLKGMRNKEELIQIVSPELEERDFAGVRTKQAEQTNLASRLNDFVGRSDEQETIVGALQNTRGFVTLLGAGGTGKTRLSQEIGKQTLGLWPGGVWFVDLSEAHTADAMYNEIAKTFRAHVYAGEENQAIGEAIRAKGECLIILDNVEQLIDCLSSNLHDWMKYAGQARFLLTSRERVKIEGEHVCYLQPLPKEDAVELFVRRARRVRPGFELNDTNRLAIESIVEKLDCVSLAIELAAARIRVMSPANIAERLGQRFKFLQSPQQEVSERQATLSGVIDWSWKLLSPWEKMALAQCSIFAGTFTLEAAEEMIDVSAWPEAPWSLDIFQDLQDKSLIFMERSSTGDNRFFMFESVRLFALNKLSEEGAIVDASNVSQTDDRAFNDVARRFVAYFSRYGQQEWLDGLNQNESEIRVQRLADETANLVTALNRAIVSGHLEMATKTFMATAQVLNMKGDPEQVIELAQLILRQSSLNPKSRMRVQLTRSIALRLSGQIGRAAIAATWLLAVAEESGESRLYADCLVEAAQLRIEEGQQEVAESYLETARRIYTTIGSINGCARVQTLLGQALIQHGEYKNAAITLQRALYAHRDNSNRMGEADVVLQMGVLATREKRYAQTHAYLDQAEELYDLANHRQGKMATLFARGELHFEEERRDSAIDILEEALRYATELKAPHWEASILGTMGAVYLSKRNLSAARTHLERAESILHLSNTPHRFALVLAYKGELDRLTGESTKAWHSLNDAAIMSGAFGTLPNTNVSRVVHRLHGALSGQGDDDPTVEVSAIF